LRCRLAMLAADYHALESAARDAMAMAERASDDELRLRAQRALADALDRLGDAEAGRTLAQTGLAEASARGLRNAEAGFLNALAVMAGRHDDSVVVDEMTRLALSISRETGDRHNETTHVLNLGVASLDLGDLAQAQRFLEQALRLAHAVGDRATEPLSLSLLAQLARWRGDASEALARAGAALEIALTVHRRDCEAFALCMLADAEMALGHPAAAGAAFERAHAAAQSIGHGAQHDATAGRARVALARGDSKAAVLHVDALLAHLGNGGTLAGTEQPRFVQLTCYQVLARTGDPRAPGVLAMAHADLQARAATITDSALRASFMENIPENRAIAAAWAAHQDAAAGTG
jgi:tetratricopeptide (TPR) repeat protein